MSFAHERLDVYQVSLELIALADGVVEALPRGRGHLADQLSRASTSIVLNLAEGAGKWTGPDKRRYYLAPWAPLPNAPQFSTCCCACN